MKIFRYILCLLSLAAVFGCAKDGGRKEFSEYYSNSKTGSFDGSKQRTHQVLSKPFVIDTIYRSMKGPVDQKFFYLADSGDIVWLTGYKVEVINAQGVILEDGFMCHNNLNLDSIRAFPWQSKNFDYQNRVFTLTQGVTELSLPDGYAIPIPGEQGFKTMYQALNHNYPDVDTTVLHKVTIEYFLDSEIDFKLKPLFMQTLWTVKQYEGPVGNMGEKPEENPKHLESIDNANYHPSQQPSCGVDMLANNEALQGNDMYYDTYARKYTGHWKIPPGKEEIEMNVDKMLNISKKRKVIMAVAHVHPFCTEIALMNEQSNEKVVPLIMKQANTGIGLNEIQVLIPEKEIWLDPTIHYSLSSTYINNSEDTLSAMSVMFLYFEE